MSKNTQSKFEMSLRKKLKKGGISPAHVLLLNEEGRVLNLSVNKVCLIIKKHVEKDMPRQLIKIKLKDGKKYIRVGLLKCDFPGNLAEAKDRLIAENYKLLESRFLNLFKKQKGKELLGLVTYAIALGSSPNEDYFIRLGRRWVGQKNPIFKAQLMSKKSAIKGCHVLIAL
jgi:hypothetical protein